MHKLFSPIGRYLWEHKIMSFAGGYLIMSVLLRTFFEIDLTIPCLWKLAFNINCPGCGLTTATIKLLRWDISGAYNANPLLFLILPIGLFYVTRNFLNFRKFLTV